MLSKSQRKVIKARDILAQHPLCSSNIYLLIFLNALCSLFFRSLLGHLSDVCHIVLSPIHHSPLPSIIGSRMWLKFWCLSATVNSQSLLVNKVSASVMFSSLWSMVVHPLFCRFFRSNCKFWPVWPAAAFFALSLSVFLFLRTPSPKMLQSTALLFQKF